VRLQPGEMSDRAAQRFGSAAAGPARLLLNYRAISSKLSLRASGIAAVRLEPVLGSCFTYSSWLAAVANEHGNRADRANDEGRSADHSDDYTNGIDDRAL